MVMARRPYHEAAIKLHLKWSPFLHFFFFLFGLAIILAPALNNNWRALITNTPMLGWFFVEFSSMGALPIILMIFGLICITYTSGKIDGQQSSTHGYPINLPKVGSPRMIVDADLYPITVEEERAYWIELIMGIYISSAWWLLLFGLISFLIL